MVQTDTLEGIIDNVLHFHYDFFADVLYLRLLSAEDTATYADLTDSGDLLLSRRKPPTARWVLTVVSWWKRFGQGALPDSIAEIQKHIEPLAKRVAA